MKIPPEYSEFCFYSVYSRGSISSYRMAGTFCVQTYKIRKNEKIEDFFEKVVDKTGVVGYNNKALFKCNK